VYYNEAVEPELSQEQQVPICDGTAECGLDNPVSAIIPVLDSRDVYFRDIRTIAPPCNDINDLTISIKQQVYLPVEFYRELPQFIKELGIDKLIL
jgi:hypothetical protein